MGMMADMAIQGECTRILKMIKIAKGEGVTDEQIVKDLEQYLIKTIEECKSGWR